MKNILLGSMFLSALFFMSGCGAIETQLSNIIEEKVSLPVGVPLEEIEIFENERNGHSMYHGQTLAAAYASAGDIVRLHTAVGPFPEGTLLLYFNDTTQDERQGKESFGLVYSLNNGETWSDRVTTPIEGLDISYIAADASIVQIDTGELLVYFYALDPKGDHNKTRTFYVASSNDGLTFDVEQQVYSTEKPFNSPEVVQHDDTWYFILNIPETNTLGIATGETAFEFGELTTFDFPGIAGAISHDGSLKLYDCSRPIQEFVYENGNIIENSSTNYNGCVPSPYVDENGAVFVVTQR